MSDILPLLKGSSGIEGEKVQKKNNMGRKVRVKGEGDFSASMPGSGLCCFRGIIE